MATIDPLDLDAIKDRIAYFPSTGRVSRDEAAIMIAVIEALREALALILPLAKGYAAEHQVGSNAVFVAEAEAALALVTGGRDA